MSWLKRVWETGSVLRWVLQGIGVTASVLLALAVSASWEYRLARGEEQEALAQLSAEFAANREALRAARERHTVIRRQALVLISHIDSLRVDRTHEVPDSLLPSLWAWHTYDPATGTLNSLIASGQLGLIQDDSLRAALASWPDRVADLNEDEVTMRDAVRDHLLPFLAQHARFRQLLVDYDPDMELPPPLTSVGPALDELLLSVELENWLVDRIQGRTVLLRKDGEISELLALNDRILGLLDRARH